MLESDTTVADAADSTPVDQASGVRHNVLAALERSRGTGDDSRVTRCLHFAPRADFPIPQCNSVRFAPTVIGS